MSRCSGCIISRTIPSEAITCRRRRVARRRLVDRQVQRYRTVTAVRIRKVMRIRGSCTVGRTVPSKAITCRRRRVARCRLVDRQVQRYRTVTTLTVLE